MEPRTVASGPKKSAISGMGSGGKWHADSLFVLDEECVHRARERVAVVVVQQSCADSQLGGWGAAAGSAGRKQEAASLQSCRAANGIQIDSQGCLRPQAKQETKFAQHHQPDWKAGWRSAVCQSEYRLTSDGVVFHLHGLHCWPLYCCCCVGHCV